jgi:tetratricopeptide (TPR) repeat protein
MENCHMDSTTEEFCAEIGRLCNAHDFDKAMERIVRALEKGSNDPEFLFRTGEFCVLCGDFEKAAGCFSKASIVAPHETRHRLALATALRQARQYDRAEQILKELIASEAASPKSENALVNLVTLYIEKGEPDKALTLCEKHIATVRSPRFHFLAGHANLALDRYDAAIKQFRITIRDSDGDLRRKALFAISNPYRKKRDYSSYIALVNDAPEGNLDANILQVTTEFLGKAGMLEKEIGILRKLVEKEPRNPIFHSLLLKKLTASDRANEKDIFECAKQWDVKFGTPADRPAYSKWIGNTIDGQRIRLGILSKTFYRHVTQTILLPLLPELAKRFELYGYYDGTRHDAFTEKVRGFFAAWRETTTLSEADAARVIHDDAIDVLIDISGHFNEARTHILTYRPAPIQIHYADSSCSLGIKAVQYRFSDAVAEPPERSDPFSTEKVLRLPHGFFLYQPFYELPEAGPCPSEKNGYVTFGSCAALHKITDTTLDLWKRALDATPTSRFVLARDEFENDTCLREYWTKRFENAGISRDRFSIVTASKEDFVRLRFYDRIDIALDTFPYSGVTTTLDALWMGVPVISYRESRFASRVCSSLLTLAGLPDLVAEDKNTFASIAAKLACYESRRKNLRQTLRKTMRHGPLSDAAQMAADMEQAIRSILPE